MRWFYGARLQFVVVTHKREQDRIFEYIKTKIKSDHHLADFRQNFFDMIKTFYTRYSRFLE